MPSEVGPGVTKLTVRFSVNTPKAVVNDLVKDEPSVTGVGEFSVTTVPLVSPMLLLRI